MNIHDPFDNLPPADVMPDDERFGPADTDSGRWTPAKPFPFVAVGDLEYHPPEFLIDGLIETDTLGLIFGAPGCGKSFMAVDLALSVASGAEFHGHDVKQGAVFFIAGEGHSGLVRRFHGRGIAGSPCNRFLCSNPSGPHSFWTALRRRRWRGLSVIWRRSMVPLR